MKTIILLILLSCAACSTDVQHLSVYTGKLYTFNINKADHSVLSAVVYWGVGSEQFEDVFKSNGFATAYRADTGEFYVRVTSTEPEVVITFFIDGNKAKQVYLFSNTLYRFDKNLNLL